MDLTLKLLRKELIIGNIWSFIFEPSQPLHWIAGQFIRVELPHVQPDQEGTRRRFTIASAPYEQVIQITTRVTTSSFKQALAQLPIGGRLNLLDLPAGDFTWQASAHPLVFVAQGIGITPFYSLLRDRTHHGLPLSATLFYANPTSQVPFETELTNWARRTDLSLMLSRLPFTATRLAAEVPQLTSSIVYVSGPKAILQLLSPPYNLPASHLKQDSFPNYSAANY